MASAYVFEADGRLPRRGTIPDSNLGAPSPRRLSQDLVASIAANKTTSSLQLYELRLGLDYQCLQIRASKDLNTQEDPILDVNSVLELAIFLSGALNLCEYPGRCLFETVQLRALISSLALLHNLDVTTLTTETWDKLKIENIPARFWAIAFQSKSVSTLSERIRYTPNAYLIQLSSQYLSFFRRGDSHLPSIVGPAIKLMFAGIAVGFGQYQHTQQILEALNQLFALRPRRKIRYEALCGLQEYTRLAASLTRESTLAPDEAQMRGAATNIISVLLKKSEEILEKEDDANPPKLGGQWPRVLATCQRGPPDLDRGWYFWGVLDCASQLTSLTDPRMLEPGFVRKVEQLLFQSRTSEYRWKAIEIILSCSSTREQQYEQLNGRLIQSLSASTTDLEPKDIQETIEAAKIIREQLDSDETAGLRFCVSPLLAGEQHLSRQNTLSSQNTWSSQDYLSSQNTWSSQDYLRSRLGLTDIDPIQSSLSEQTSPESSPRPGPCPPELLWHEEDMIQSRAEHSQAFSIRFDAKAIHKTSHRPRSVGLSKDCKSAIFYNDTAISIFRLTCLQATSSRVPAFPKIFQEEYKEEYILNVAASVNFVLIATNKRMITISISEQSSVSEIDSTPHGVNWDPSGLACYECCNQLVVLLGERRSNHNNRFEGHIKVFKRNIDDCTRLKTYFTIPLPDCDLPKIICYNAEGNILACVTAIHNRVLAWKLKDDFSGTTEILNYQKNKYAAETEVTGITSACIYKSPTNRFYILCTTAPSSERWRNKGEWSFIIPLPLGSPITPPAHLIRPPGTTIHNFEQFNKHRALFGGCVSSQHNVFAVLEKTGKISVLSLSSHDEGGVYSAQDHAVSLSASATTSLCGQSRSGASGMGFEPEAEGGRLIAVDVRGKVVVTEFVKD